MYFFENIEIYLLDINKDMTNTWERFFKNVPNVKVINNDFASFMNQNPQIEAIVSPANSFGIMTGGYDKAIIDYFGKDLMKDVQDYIIEHYCGEQPVGTSFSIPINNFNKSHLIHTPTMRTPEVINDSRVIYSCMRSTLIECLKKNYGSVVIPAFGACTGKVDYREVANMMRLAYEQLTHIPDGLNWANVLRFELYEHNQYSHAEGFCNNPSNPNFNKIPCSHNVSSEKYKRYTFEDTGSYTIA